MWKCAASPMCALRACENTRFWKNLDQSLRKYSQRFERMKPAAPVMRSFELFIILTFMNYGIYFGAKVVGKYEIRNTKYQFENLMI